jgi:hypothetical protein
MGRWWPRHWAAIDDDDLVTERRSTMMTSSLSGDRRW